MSKETGMRELTLELTNYCPHNCPFCSSDAGPSKSAMLPLADALRHIHSAKWDRINLSGGEPLAHPRFWAILQNCNTACADVVLYSNALHHVRYNAHVIDGIVVEAAVTVQPGVSGVHILRRIPQGREARRPEVHMSRNWYGECGRGECGHVLVRPDGGTGAPCAKRPGERSDHE